MEVRYVAVYKLTGVSTLPGDGDVDLVDLPELDARALLTVNPDSYCFHIDRFSALLREIMNGILGQTEGADLSSRLADQQQQVQKNRRKKFGAGVFLVIEGKAEITEPDFRVRRDLNEIAFCFDGYAKDEVHGSLRSVVSGVLAVCGLGIPAKKDFSVKYVGDVSYLYESETDKAVYSITERAGSIVASLSGPLEDETVHFVGAHAKTLCTDKLLSKIANLYIQSFETQTDTLRSFIVAWAALEIFVNSQFKARYEETWVKTLEKRGSPTTQDFSPNPTGKFIVIASILNEDGAETDVADFKQLKCTRDKLFHGSEVPVLPVEQAQNLLRKYLRLHLERMT